MANAYVETRISIARAIIVTLAVLVSGLFTWGAVAVPEPGWWTALPMNAVGVALVLVGSRRRSSTEGQSGGAAMAWGAVVVAASVVVSFALGNAT
jgi:hypothetical protein